MINGLVMARVGFIVLRHCVWRESRDWGLFCCVWLRFVSCYYECNTSCVYLNVEPGASSSSSTWRMEHSLIETLDHWAHAPTVKARRRTKWSLQEHSTEHKHGPASRKHCATEGELEKASSSLVTKACDALGIPSITAMARLRPEKMRGCECRE